MPRLPLNPLDRSPAARDGVPVIGGRFPKVGHLPAIAWDMPLFLTWAKREYGPCAWVDRGFGSHILQLAGDASFDVFAQQAHQLLSAPRCGGDVFSAVR